MRILLAIFMVVVLAAAGIAALAWRQYVAFLETPLDLPESGAVLLLEPGMSGRDVASELVARGYTQPGWKWRLLMRLEPAVLKAGEYRLDPPMTPLSLWHKMDRGDVLLHQFTIVEGWTVRQLAAALMAAGLLTVDEGRDPVEQALDSMPEPPDPPEGWFLPETYAYVRGDGAGKILQRSYQDMQTQLEQAWAMRVNDHPASSPYELLVLASIIEKETGLESERGAISGVFVRRLALGMRLQTDPTVIYGLGENFDGNLRRTDLQTDTPYNTYTRHGLPPTPIALPGRASLVAAAQPEPGETLYFVANGTGGHTFSKTLQEHQQAVQKLIRLQRSQ